VESDFGDLKTLACAAKRSLCQRKTEGGLEKELANRWNRKRITKKSHTGRGQEAKWEMSDQTVKTMFFRGHFERMA
jgi:hypothetical protein